MLQQTPSQKQEAAIRAHLAFIFGKAKVQPGSGNQATAPNDVAVHNQLHVECKTTAAASLVVKYDWLVRARNLALQFGVKAFIAIRFHTYQANDFFIVSDTDLYPLLQCEHQNEQLLQQNKELQSQIASLKSRMQYMVEPNRSEPATIKHDAYEGQLTRDAYEGQLKKK